MLTHANLVANLEAMVQIFKVDQDDTALSLLPLCHGFERLVAYIYLSQGVSMIFAESLETVGRDIKAVRPTVMTGVPRLYQKLHARIMASGREGSAIKRAIFSWAVGVADARGRAFAAGRAPSPWLALQVRVADALVFQKIRAGLGGRFRFAASGSAPLGETLGRFFYGIGLPLIEGYGLTETSPVLAVMPLEAIRFGTVGPPLPNVELKIAEDGEILARGPNVMSGYYNRPEDTAAVLKDGWFYTGDIGELDERGYLRITDRKKELLVHLGRQEDRAGADRGRLAGASAGVRGGAGRRRSAFSRGPHRARVRGAGRHAGCGETRGPSRGGRAGRARRCRARRTPASSTEVNATSRNSSASRQFHICCRGS